MTRLVLMGWAILAVALAALWVRQLRTKNTTSVFVPWPTKVTS